MSKEDERFLVRLMATFKVEANEHLKTMSTLLFSLEKAPSDAQSAQLVETLFREAHSLKGAARSVNLVDVEALCQALESALAALKRQELALSAQFFEVLYHALDMLGQLLAASDAGKPEAGMARIAEVVAALGNLPPASVAMETAAVATTSREPVSAARAALKDAQSEVNPGPKPDLKGRLPLNPEADADATVRISTAKLNALLVQAEEMLAFKFSAGHLSTELGKLNGELAGWRKNWAKVVRDARTERRAAERRREGVRLDKKPVRAERLLEVVERDEIFVKSFADRLAQLERLAEQERRALAAMVDNLLEDMKQALMLPFSSLLEMVPKMVRDLARDSGKEVELAIDTAPLEIDRRILEQMKDPLMHLVRNAIDHGIEPPEERRRRNKPQCGRITIEINPKEGNRIELVVADDGAGIDIVRVASSAQKMDLLTPESMPDWDRPAMLALVFESGLSTSQILTDISGRGLGLAIVREKVEKLGGSVTAESPEAGGTRFCITLPTTLATFRGVLVALGDDHFVIPSRNVERVARVPIGLVKTVENRETIALEGQVLSLVRLGDVLGVGRYGLPASQYLSVAVLASGGKRVAFAVDAVLGDQEVLLKGLGPQLVRVRNVSGATILGAGRVVPILNATDLMKSACKFVPLRAHDTTPAAAVRRSILVVEDSISSRALLKNILESAGYDVAAAVDGIDALTTLRTGRFDLVVSDVEMPRMDGFDLTVRIRADKKLAELPVILVSALESREHKERGIDVGASAYIVKRGFDQGNLLDMIRRLI